jgi:uncharacterized protein
MRRTLVVAGLVMAQLFATTASAGKRRPEERMDVADVLAAGDGQYVVVLKTSGKPARYLPIWVGENDALGLKMRLDRRTPPRPLTLNLLEQVLSATNVKLVEVAIDDYKDGVFLGKIRLKQNGRMWELEARPSDAIGLAMGKHVPILVARDIVDGVGIDPGAGGGLPKSPAVGSDKDGPDAAGLTGSNASAYYETL